MTMPESFPEPDPKGLIREAYRIHGIALTDCRSIFLDWALSIPEGIEPCIALQKLYDRYAADAPDHPMTGILLDGLASAPAPRRRRRRMAQMPGIAEPVAMGEAVR